MARLGGWQRLGVVASAVWVAATSAMVAAEWVTLGPNQSGDFVYRLPVPPKPVTDPALIRKLEAEDINDPSVVAGQQVMPAAALSEAPTGMPPLPPGFVLDQDPARPATATGVFDDLIPKKKHLKVWAVLLAIFGPITVAWVLTYLIYFAVRWVREGFSANRT